MNGDKPTDDDSGEWVLFVAMLIALTLGVVLAEVFA